MTTKFAQLAIAALSGAGLATLLFTVTPLRAQTNWMPMGGQMYGNRWQGQPMRPDRLDPGDDAMPCLSSGVFDPANLETLQGTATEIDRYGGHQGMFLTLTTAQETLAVHLGPAWYLQDQGFDIATNSPIEVTGFRSTWNGRSVLMASAVKQGDRVLQLRDAKGYPLWMQQDLPAH
ncbi:hypothetical protein [Nodosilinea nodulosa]|uniref:hypothetical protein n=1 Tax=Nodosilinea nodulosa TaxID=416001 RepID=UPI0002D85D7C|nr:hypothetical protein [Nodosilinea nodulosa]